MSTYFFALRGTAEKQGDAANMLYRAYLEATVPMTYADIPYPASISVANEGQDIFGTSLAMSIGAGINSLKQHIEQVRANDPDAKIIVAGYSLGCLVILTALRDDRYVAENIDRIILLANPATKYLLNSGGTRKGKPPFLYEGIATGVITDEVILNWGRSHLDAYTVNWVNDPIAYLHPKSPIRSAVPWLWALDLDELPEWFGDVRARLDSKITWAWTRFWEPGYRDAALESISDLLRYAKFGDHTTAYTKVGNFSWVNKPVSGVWVVGRLASSEAWVND